MKTENATNDSDLNGTFWSELAEEIIFDFDLQEIPFAILFNRIPNTLRLEDYGLSTRIYNSLNRHGYGKLGEALQIDVRKVESFKNLGQRSVKELVGDLIALQVKFAIKPELAVESARQVNSEDAITFPALQDLLPQLKANENAAKALAVMEDLSRFIYYAGTSEQSILEFLSHEKLSSSPFLGVLGELEANDFISKEQALSGLTKELAFFVDEFKDKELEVFKHRLLTYPQPTLDAIGEAIGVTRERVRQIEAKVKSKFQSFKNENRALRMLLGAIDFRLTEPLQKKTAIKIMPILGERFFLKFSILDLLLGLGELSLDGEWIMRDLRRVSSEFDAVVKKSSHPKLLDSKATFDDLAVLWAGLTKKTFTAWMEDHGYERVLDYWIKNPTLVDYGFAALARAARPLTAQEMFDLAKSSGNVRTLENALAASDIFSRTGKKQWSLTSWGNKQYKSIRDAIEEIVDNEGSIAFDQLVARLSDFGVKRNSIKAYATSPPFTIVGGFVRKTAATRVVRKTITSTKNLYFWGQGVAYRLTITGEHLRGSGCTCPAALAKFLEVPDNGGVAFEGPHGAFRVSSQGHMYNLPSTRQAIESLQLGIGDQLLIKFGAGTVEFSKVETEGNTELQIRSIIGAVGKTSLEEQLSLALFGDKTGDFELSLNACEKRNEADLAKLISQQLE